MNSHEIVQILVGIYRRDDQTRSYELYNDIYVKVMDDNCSSILAALHQHAHSIEKPEYNIQLTQFLTDMQLFFRAIADVFVLFDDFCQLKDDIFLCSKKVYVDVLDLNYDSMAAVFLQTYRTDPEASRQFYSCTNALLAPFTAAFDAAVNTAIKADFQVFIQM